MKTRAKVIGKDTFIHRALIALGSGQMDIGVNQDLENRFLSCETVEGVSKSFSFAPFDDPEYRNRILLIPMLVISLHREYDLTQVVNDLKLDCEIHEDISNRQFICFDSTIVEVKLTNLTSDQFIFSSLLESVVYLRLGLGVVLSNWKFARLIIRLLPTAKELLLVLLGRGNEFERFHVHRKFRVFVYLTLQKLGLNGVAEPIRYRALPLEEFLKLSVFCGNLTDRFVRRNQLSVVTDNFRNVTVQEIIDFFKHRDLDAFRSRHVVNPKQMHQVTANQWLDLNFWFDGNTHFFGNIYYGFRHDVVAYESVSNEFSDALVFSMEYFGGKKSMSSADVKRLLEQNPITIRKTHLTGGRHRVFAMIGRLVSGGDYIPFKVDMCG